jgi:dTDP-4-amino-4,6-dideoxygalactose transaminase
MTDTIARSARRDFLPFNPPLVGEEEIREVVDTLRSPWITTGPKTRRFEEEFCAFIRAPGALALNSCTAAMHTALACLGIGPGDEVITTPMTFTATANVIEHVGATPVFVDHPTDARAVAGALRRAPRRAGRARGAGTDA